MRTGGILPEKEPSLVGTLVANSFPLVGVIALGWNVSALLVLYWVEIGSVIAWAAVKALFAARPPTVRSTRIPLHGLLEKRGGVRLREWLPPVYPHNVPHVVGVGVILGPAWLVSGYSLFVLQGTELLGSIPGSLAVTGTVPAAALGTFVARGVSVWTVYLGTEEYRDRLARTVAAAPATYLLAMWAFASVVKTAVPPGSGGIAVLVGIVGLKLGYERYRHRTGRTDGHAWTLVTRVFDADGTGTKSTDDEMAMPGGEPTLRFTTDLRAVRRNALLFGLLNGLVLHGVFVVFPVWFLLEGVTSTTWATAVAGVLVVGIAAAKGLEGYLEHGSMEYRLYDGELVAYDRLLDAPQWRVSYGELSEVTVINTLLPEPFPGRDTLKLERDDGSIRLEYLADAERAAAAIDARIW